MNRKEESAALSSAASGDHIDYSEVYRKLETKQLNKRLRKTRIILLISSFAVVGGALVFWIMPETSFTTRNFLIYLALAIVLAMFSVFSKRYPYLSILAGLVICIAFWAIEIIMKNTDDLLIEGSIQKLFIISLLVSCLHASKEAELIRKELHFS
jgi:hypothetical protein